MTPTAEMLRHVMGNVDKPCGKYMNVVVPNLGFKIPKNEREILNRTGKTLLQKMFFSPLNYWII